MVRCGFCNNTSVTGTGKTLSGQQMVLVVCSSCRAVLAAASTS